MLRPNTSLKPTPIWIAFSTVIRGAPMITRCSSLIWLACEPMLGGPRIPGLLWTHTSPFLEFKKGAVREYRSHTSASAFRRTPFAMRFDLKLGKAHFQKASLFLVALPSHFLATPERMWLAEYSIRELHRVLKHEANSFAGQLA
jgi:hypothetical protein